MALRTEELILNLGPQHPSTHGVLRMIVTLEGENIVEVAPDIGYLHSSVEKMMEYRTYLQSVSLADRGMDYLAALANEEALLRAVETLGGISVPERAQWLRVILLELQRISSHLVWLGTWGADLGATTMFLWCFREREKVLDLFERVTGGRLHHVYFRPGGVCDDIPDGWVEQALAFCDEFPGRIAEYEGLFTANPIFEVRTRGVGVLPRELAVNLGASGPVARASGIAFDVRKAFPYEKYAEVDFDIPVRQEGDCFARYQVRVEEMRQSTRIIRQAVAKLPPGEIRAPKIPVTLRLPRGEVYTRTESPRGDLGIYLVSDGEEHPYRVKIRAP
ncbi:MAG: NADH-quinone oxidoreductase subunit D, partial [Armatimonadota bacterium]|nr:NADH-quinone oxidoreductase subunit D [Armatimonadota bacterium]